MGVDPVTIAIISAGLQVAGGIQSMQQSNAMAKASRQNAEVNIANEKNRLAIEQQQLKRDQEKARGTSRVSAAVSGAGLQSFDSLNSDADNQMLLDQALLEYDSKLQQESFRYSGAMQSAEYKAQGKEALLSSLTSAAKTGMQGVDYYNTQKGLNAAKASNRSSMGG